MKSAGPRAQSSVWTPTGRPCSEAATTLSFTRFMVMKDTANVADAAIARANKAVAVVRLLSGAGMRSARAVRVNAHRTSHRPRRDTRPRTRKSIGGTGEPSMVSCQPGRCMTQVRRNRFRYAASEYYRPNRTSPRITILSAMPLASSGASRPPTRTGSIRRASPVMSSVSTKTPQTVASPSAGPSFSPGILRQNRSVRPVLHHADNAVVVAAHAGVGLESRAARQDLRIGGRAVRVGADDERHLTVENVCVGHFLAARLGMDVGDDGLHRGAKTIFR